MSAKADEIRSAAVVVWVNYGYEGWQPTGFGSMDAALRWIEAGVPGEFVVTVPARLRVEAPRSDQGEGT